MVCQVGRTRVVMHCKNLPAVGRLGEDLVCSQQHARSLQIPVPVLGAEASCAELQPASLEVHSSPHVSDCNLDSLQWRILHHSCNLGLGRALHHVQQRAVDLSPEF